jgi:hypothetical protein
VNTGRRGKNIERQNTKQTYYEVQLMALIIYPLVFIYNEKKIKNSFVGLYCSPNDSCFWRVKNNLPSF